MTNTENRQTFIRFADVRKGDTIYIDPFNTGAVDEVLHHGDFTYISFEGDGEDTRQRRWPSSHFVAIDQLDEIRYLLKSWVRASRYVTHETSGSIDEDLDALAAESGRLSKLFGLEWGADLDPRLA